MAGTGSGELASGSGPGRLASVKRTSTHVVEYTVLNSGNTHETGRDWTIDVAASPAELARLAEEGYLLREGLCAGAMLEQLRTALDNLERRESTLRDRQTARERSWGFLPRHLMDKDPACLALAKFRPVLSIAQAMMGPRATRYGGAMVARVRCDRGCPVTMTAARRQSGARPTA